VTRLAQLLLLLTSLAPIAFVQAAVEADRRTRRRVYLTTSKKAI
jgi:hypothetical protein